MLFTLVAVGFLAFALPCFLFVRERGNPSPEPVLGAKAIVASLRRTADTLRDTERHPGLLRFRLERLLYTDAIDTVVATMMLFAANVAEAGGTPVAEAERRSQLVLLAAITCAVLGGLLWGRVVDRIGPQRTLMIVLALWLAVFASASAIGLLGLPFETMWGLGALTGLALGGVWTADRPLLLRLTPPDRVGAFYGVYGMVGRFAAVIGPAMWGATTALAVRALHLSPAAAQGVAILLPLGMVGLGLVVIRRVDDRHMG
jgi:UMF1 family MFS transporter